MKLCPCGSAQPYSKCCDIFLSGKAPAPTPEALMRSRYTAYTQDDTHYIEQTMKGPALLDFYRSKSPDRPSSKIQWLRLEVLDAVEAPPRGWVEFKAYFFQDNQPSEYILHERSEFLLEEGFWYYVDGIPNPPCASKNHQKTGRNDPCICGSGKKFKKCCDGKDD